MNAFVTYEQEDDGVVVHRVYVGEGKTKELLKEFYKEVSEQFGPPPELIYSVSEGLTSPTKDSEQILNNWRATVHAAKNPHRFGNWLVEKHNWVECDNVHQESL